ncbi:transcription termination factor NusA [Wolbachia endosymbiont of Pentidionis agamae]|uniref:transcription termination factor NusA n=1 Tax=Wolbachia endosymbiont of Pentidionis agamae TaxID=3110435 RepID=UPI002FD571F8
MVTKRGNVYNNLNGTDIIRAAKVLAEQKGLDFDFIVEALENSIEAVAYEKYGVSNDITCVIDRSTGVASLSRKLKVVEDMDSKDGSVISFVSAKLIKEDVKVGDVIFQDLPINIDVASARVAQKKIAQIIKDKELAKQYEEFKGKIGDLVYGVVKQVEYGNLTVDLNGSEAFFPSKNLLKGEVFRQGDRIKACIENVKPSSDGRQIILSRVHKGFLEQLLKQEVPEVSDGLVVIKSIARDAGSRSKVAVFSSDKNIDPVGACVGIRGHRVKSIISELQGEKLDIINYSSELGKFIINAIAPAEVSKVVIDEDENYVELVVPEDQLSLAIGKKGQNIRLASELVGWDIKILSTQEESDKRSRELREVSALFAECLNVDEIIGQLLVTEGFLRVEDIAYAPISELTTIEAFTEDIAIELHDRANQFLRKQVDEKKQRLANLEVDSNLIDLPLSLDAKVKLAENHIKTLQDIADLSNDELYSMLCTLHSNQEELESLKSTVDSVIMKARKKLGLV